MRVCQEQNCSPLALDLQVNMYQRHLHFLLTTGLLQQSSGAVIIGVLFSYNEEKELSQKRMKSNRIPEYRHRIIST
jgi:hypothetical protein